MELIPKSDVFQTDKRNTKKVLLDTDAVCIRCGVIFNSVYEDQCVICADYEERCDHKEFIIGKESVNLRILLDFNMEDLRALCEIHGCPEGGSRSKMVINIMKRLYLCLDRRIDERLVRKIIIRNRKKFRFWRDIEGAITRAKKSRGIPLIDKSECIDEME